jgi:hypothetical protein
MLIEIGAVSLLVFVAGFFLWPIARAARRQRRLDAWHAVTGTVLEHRRRAAADGMFAEFLVRYEAGGVVREEVCGSADRLPYRVNDGEGDAAHRLSAVADRYLGRYPVGAPIPLRVNPANPTIAYVRERGMPMIAIGIGVAAAFAALIWVTVTVMF